MPSPIRRSVSHTVLVVGEGADEQAFLKYIKSLYIIRGCGVGLTIRNARGKGPDHIVDFTIRQKCNAEFDRVLVLLDTDLNMSDAVRRRARSHKIQVIGSTPCFEGLLLKILGEYVPATSRECKQRRGVELPEKLTLQEHFEGPFPKDLLDRRREDVPELAQILNSLSFG